VIEGDGPSERQSGGDRPPPAPRWVKVTAAVAAAVLVLVVTLLATGSGHGPRRHTVGPFSGGEADAAGNLLSKAVSG
jgi:hypothetical protein